MPNPTSAKNRVAIVGATGYAGIETLRILLQHPRVEVAVVTSQQYVGKPVSAVYPALLGKCDSILQALEPEKIAAQADLVFTALPHETSMGVIASLVKHGVRTIDLSADFRLHDAAVYRRWYREHEAPELLAEAVYGLTELHRKQIAEAVLIANPGCYPTAAVLGMAPLFAKNLVRGTVVIDAKSGVTGAGRSSTVELSFSEVNENFKAYNVALHRHSPEIEQELSEITRRSVPVLFVPHLAPMNRGILSTMYVPLDPSVSDEELVKIYREFYHADPFIRVLPSGRFPETKDVRGSNDCAIGLRYDAGTRTLVVISAIDNLVKGAAGQAVQNMNLMYGWPEDEGLRGAALVP
ncbi:MAG TPA: N-acetyl-gamma-glutamyl-phosphate reductase [Candidatus Binatia bacterium]|nr:N-acetyl-gamma-glutamyl-phosphate reductase [Candidatus Binatia bacterium]